MSCSACIIAAINVRTARFDAGRIECAARSLAGAPQFFEAVQANAITPDYRDRLNTIFGSDIAGGHAKVKGYADRIAAARKSTR